MRQCHPPTLVRHERPLSLSRVGQDWKRFVGFLEVWRTRKAAERLQGRQSQPLDSHVCPPTKTGHQVIGYEAYLRVEQLQPCAPLPDAGAPCDTGPYRM